MFGHFVSTVLTLITKWSPKEYSKELEYRDDLLQYLKENVNQTNIFGKKEAHIVRKETGPGSIDIVIDRKIGIELKYNLKRKAEVDRLFGQISGFKQTYSNVIVVLCGNTDGDKLEYFRGLVLNIPRDMFSSSSLEIIVKGEKVEENSDESDSFDDKLKRLF